MVGCFDGGVFRCWGTPSEGRGRVSSAGIKVDGAGSCRGIAARPREAAAWLETESILTIDHGMWNLNVPILPLVGRRNR